MGWWWWWQQGPEGKQAWTRPEVCRAFWSSVEWESQRKNEKEQIYVSAPGELGSTERPSSSLHQEEVAWLSVVYSTGLVAAEGRTVAEQSYGICSEWPPSPYAMPRQQECFERMWLKCQGQLNGSQRSPLGSPESAGLEQSSIPQLETGL